MIHYGMTKTAQIAIARGLAESTKGTAVTVNTVLPGPSRSEGVETFVQQIADQQGMTFDEMEKEFFDNIRPSSLIQRFATPEEDANMIVYLCGKGAAATNGAAVRVDGGVVKAAL
jgi:NAD(P)-dependent dehydrogenase (short-subunit alcohol dehydrogenase family)